MGFCLVGGGGCRLTFSYWPGPQLEVDLSDLLCSFLRGILET